ncbi:helix-turn-helix domain-containing protein [Nocardia wallacei]|uniref:helix-turn-helix domain-containing protein n=1 Tax=Nocardia wallacei TaxID=480035 RepID=UPI0024561DD0|nr:helix-turn-helix transcriptional regulator [Nocardia wallacei]
MRYEVADGAIFGSGRSSRSVTLVGQALRELDPRSSALAAFGAELRDRRIESRRSLTELGRLVLVSGDLLGKIEKGQRRPQADLVRRLDEVLRAEGKLERLAAAVEKPRSCTADPVPASSFTPEGAEDRLRKVIVGARAADHCMAADRVEKILGYTRAAEAMAPKLPRGARSSLLRTVAEGQQLAGWMLFDCGQSQCAERMFGRARSSAERVRAMDLVAYVGGPNLAFMNTWSGNPAVGVEQAYGALAWAYRSGNSRLAAFVATIAARAHAKMGEAGPCSRMLSVAESELGRHKCDDQDPSWLAVFDAAALAGHRGSCLLDLGKPRQAVQAFKEQKSSGPDSFVRNKVIWQLEQAEANLRLGALDAAATDVEHTLDQVERQRITPRVVCVFRAVDLKLRTAVTGHPKLEPTRERLREFIEACA